MKMKINKKAWKSAVLSCGLLSLALFASCGDGVIGQTPTDGDAPGQVTDVQITSIPGGAEISYTLPKDEDLLYVEARYKMKGKECNLKASCFTNKITIQGYADVDEHDVELIAVDRSKNSSAPVSAKFTPLENPVYAIAKSIEMKRGLGGIGITWKNITEAAIKLFVYAADDAGAMQLVEVLSSEMKDGSYDLHGYDDQERRFAVLIKDHWDNPSDTISGYFTPRYEKEIPGKDFKRFLCPEDNNTSLGGNWGWEKMFDDVAGVDNNGWHTSSNGTGHGVYFTVDLGHKVKLTRIKLWQRGGSWPYRQNNVRQFEVYARAESPENIYSEHGTDDTEYWSQGFRTDAANWNHLMHCITPKPSGFDNFDITAADKEYAYLGHEYLVDEDAPAVRYVRFTIDETWGGGDLFNCSELKFYGKIVDE